MSVLFMYVRYECVICVSIYFIYVCTYVMYVCMYVICVRYVCMDVCLYVRVCMHACIYRIYTLSHRTSLYGIQPE
jgi:hypothetical protein